MSLYRSTWVIAAVVALLFVARVDAQFGGLGRPPVNSLSRPAVSPYLNLNRGGVPAINYYGLVRPQQQTALAIQGLQYQQEQLLSQQFGTTQSGYSGSGHATSFMNYSHYYPRLGGSGGGGSNNIQPFSVPNR